MKKLVLGVLSVLVSFSLMAQLELNDKLPFDTSVTHGTLENGMEYYIKSNPIPENRAELTLVVNAGSVLEDDDQRGLAHFNEHMAFNGTKNFPKHELINYLESTGMKFGAEVNAYTSFDETVYGITIPMDNDEMVKNGLLVLHDWAHLVSLEGEEIDAERGVIHEEWRMGQGAEDRMRRVYFPVLFNGSKYAERLPIGTMEVVDNCEHDALRRFYRDWYRPDLMSLVVVGDFDQAEMETKIKEMFSKIPARENPRKRPIVEIPEHKETLAVVATDKENPMPILQMITKFPAKPMVTVADYKEQIIEGLVSSMMSARLQELTMSDNAPFIQGFAGKSAFIGSLSAYMGLAIPQGNDIFGAMEALVAENQRAKQFGFTETELDREKSSMLTMIEKYYNERNKRKSADIVKELQSNYLFPFNPVPGIEYEYQLYKKYVPLITLKEVNAAISSYVTSENTVIVAMAPEKEGFEMPTKEELLAKYKEFSAKEVTAYEDKVNTKPFIATMPTSKPVIKEEVNEEMGSTTWEFANGVKVIIKQTNFKDDEILVRAKSEGGSSLYEQKDDISADIATDVAMESGLGDYDKIELEKFLADKNARLYPYIGETSEGLSGSCSTKDIETMLQMVYLNFTKPRVNEKAFNNYIKKTKALLENQKLNPESVWQDSIGSIMSSNHPRRRSLTPELLDEASYKRIRRIMRKSFGDPCNFTFYFVGNINPTEVKPLFEKYFGGLPTVDREETYADLNVVAPQGAIRKDVYAGSDAKSMVVINFHGEMKYDVKSRLELDAISKVLSTKLLEEIREKKSGVYTIGAYPNASNAPKEKYGVTIFFSCDPERVDELTDGVFAEITKLQENGPTEEDFNKVVKKVSRELETNVKENRYWMSKLQEVEEGNYTEKDIMDYQGKYIDKLSVKKLKKAAKRYFDKENYVRVVLKPEQK